MRGTRKGSFRNPTAIPDGVTPAAYAATLAKTVSQTYPSEYFAARIADKSVAQRLPQGWSQSAALLPNNDPRIATTASAHRDHRIDIQH